MNIPSYNTHHDLAHIALASAEVLFDAGGTGSVWQLTHGALRLDRITREGPRFIQIVLPGDVMGLELLASSPYTYTARAIVPSRAQRLAFISDAERYQALVHALAQQQRRLEDLVRLRSGTAQDRLKHLLLLLAPAAPAWTDEGTPCALPTIRDVAAILDTAPETVSRIFANLRRSQLLEDRQRQSASFSAVRLREVEWPSGMTRSDKAQRLDTPPA